MSKPKTRCPQLIVGLCIGFATLVCGCLSAEVKLEGTQPAQWRVVWLSDPSTEATICWSTAELAEKNVVHYESGKQDRGTVSSHRDGKHTGGNTYYHHVKLSELKPATRYTLVIESDGRRSPEMHFRTSPVEDVDIKIIFGGDSRSSQENRCKMNQMIAQYVQKDQTIMALAHGGDYIGNGRSFEDWNQWMSDHESTLTSDSQLVPIIPTRGNHDAGPLYNEIFDDPGGATTNYFAINIGPQIRWITLNTEITTSGDQANWLEHEISQSRPKHRWLLAQYHRPAYPAVKKPGSALKSWVPIFEKYNLDIACEADGHNIKRTMAIRNDKPDATGVVYIGEGGLGVKQRTPDKSRWFLKEPSFASSGHHFQLLSFSGDRLKCESIMLGGEIVDSVQLKARR